MKRFLIVIGAVNCLLALAATGCGHDVAAQPSRPNRVPAPSPTSTNAAALAAYRSMWMAYAETVSTTEYRSDGLPATAMGAALETLREGIHKDRREHVISRGEPVLHARVVSTHYKGRAGDVHIVDCLDDSHWLRYRADSGKSVDDVPGGRHRAEALVRRVGGPWKVTRFFITKKTGTC